MSNSRLLILLISLLSLIGCNKAGEEKCEIKLTESAISIPGSEGQVSVPYTLTPSSSDAVVEASVDAGWLSVAGVTSSEVILVVSANNYVSSRTAMLTLSKKGASDVVCHIVQNPNDGSLGIFPESKLVYVEPGESDITLNFEIKAASVFYQVMPGAQVSADWLQVTRVTMSSVLLHVNANAYDERAAEVSISFMGLDPAKVVIVQNPVLVKSSIRLPSAVVTEDFTAHSFEVPYSVSGASAGQPVVAETVGQAPWLHITGVSSSKISFGLDENATEANRSAEVMLSLPDARPVVLSVIQKADGPFDISVRNVTSAGATVTFAPKSSSMTYAYSVEPKALFEKYGSDAYIEAYLESLIEMAEENGVGLKDLLTSGTKTITIDDLKDGTDYYALAFDLDADGKSSGKVTILEFSTPKATPSENKFSFQVSETGVVSVKTANDDPYIFDVWDISSWEDFETPLALAERFVEYMKGFEGALQTYTHRGDYSEDYKQYLTPGKNVAFAFGYKDGITTDVYYYVFDW